MILRQIAEWVQAQQTDRILNCEKFMLTAQTGSVLARTLLYLASLIENLLGVEHDFALTSRFQSDALEKHLGNSSKLVMDGF